MEEAQHGTRIVKIRSSCFQQKGVVNQPVYKVNDHVKIYLRLSMTLTKKKTLFNYK